MYIYKHIVFTHTRIYSAILGASQINKKYLHTHSHILLIAAVVVDIFANFQSFFTLIA